MLCRRSVGFIWKKRHESEMVPLPYGVHYDGRYSFPSIVLPYYVKNLVGIVFLVNFAQCVTFSPECKRLNRWDYKSFRVRHKVRILHRFVSFPKCNGHLKGTKIDCDEKITVAAQDEQYYLDDITKLI